MSFSMHRGAQSRTCLEGSVIRHVVLGGSSGSSLDGCRRSMSHPVQPLNHSGLTNLWSGLHGPIPHRQENGGDGLALMGLLRTLSSAGSSGSALAG